MKPSDPVLVDAIQKLIDDCESLIVVATECYRDAGRVKEIQFGIDYERQQQREEFAEMPEDVTKARAMQKYGVEHIEPLLKQSEELKIRCESAAKQTREVVLRLLNLCHALPPSAAKKLNKVLGLPYPTENTDSLLPEGWLRVKSLLTQAIVELGKLVGAPRKISSTRVRMREPITLYIRQCKEFGKDIHTTAEALDESREFAHDDWIKEQRQAFNLPNLTWGAAAKNPDIAPLFKRKFDKA